jgi:hypothetical protein
LKKSAGRVSISKRGKMKNVSYFIIFILLLFGFNCKNVKHEEQPSVTEEVIDGVRIVHNFQKQISTVEGESI